MEKPFSRGQAWIDLIMWADKTNGQVIRPQRFWARRWGWTRSKVQRFFVYLNVEEMIAITEEGGKFDGRTRQASTMPNTINISNYSKYQVPANTPPDTTGEQLEQEVLLKQEGGSNPLLKKCKKCKKNFRPTYEHHELCGVCYSQKLEKGYKHLPKCPNPNCTIQSPTQQISEEEKGCNFCKPYQVPDRSEGQRT